MVKLEEDCKLDKENALKELQEKKDAEIKELISKHEYKI